MAGQPLQVDSVSQQTLPKGLVWKDWRERKGELFQAVRWKKHDGSAAQLIVAVAAFNIVTLAGLLIWRSRVKSQICKRRG